MVAFLPFLVLIALLVCCISVFGNATLDGASQVSLIIASGVSVLVGWCSKRLSWDNLDKEMTKKVASCTPSIIILLLIGAIGGTWMVSGIVPTMIYSGLQILDRLIVDHHSHRRCGVAWDREGVGFFRRVDSRRHHQRCLFR